MKSIGECSGGVASPTLVFPRLAARASSEPGDAAGVVGPSGKWGLVSARECDRFGPGGYWSWSRGVENPM